MKNIPLVECWNFVGSTPQKFDGEKRYISTGALDKDHINESDVEMVTFDNRPSRANLEVNSGDILFAKMASTEKTFVVDSISENDIYSTGFCAVRANESKILSKCLYYFLSSSLFLQQKDKNSSGATQKAITNSGLSKIYINLPELTEQKEFIEQMDSLTSLITARREQLAKLDELVKSRFIELFGDPKYNKSNLVKIGEIGALTSGGTPSRAKPEYFEGDIRWYSAGELNSLYLPDSVEHISERALQQSSAKLFNKGTLMIGMYDTAAFKMGILTEDSSSNQACANLNPKQGYNIVWLYYLFDIMKPIFLQERQGVRQKNLSLSKIKEFEVPFAPFELQEHFASLVEQVDKSKLAIQESLEKLETLKKALMQKYFG